MSLLILTLPPGPAAAATYEYTTSPDGQASAGHGATAAALLPAAGRGVEVVALVPAARLSWHRVALPKGVGPGAPRLRAVLEGLLEDRLLDAPGDLHFALEPGASGGATVWVAVCPRAWLREHVQGLDAVQRPVTRIIPELAPSGRSLQLFAIEGDAGAGWLLARGGALGAVHHLPLSPGALATLPLPETQARPGEDDLARFELRAEPAVAEATETLFGTAPRLLSRAERLLAASHTRWDLAQLDLARSTRARAGKQAARWWRSFAFAPAWRPARWGLAVLLLAHLAGLNAWAFKEQRALSERRAQVNRVLTDTFPQVRVVVDAPVQMAREVELLRAASGSVSGGDLESLLSLIGQHAPDAPPPAGIDYSAGELRLKGVSLSGDALNALGARLAPSRVAAHTEGDTLVLRATATPAVPATASAAPAATILSQAAP